MSGPPPQHGDACLARHQQDEESIALTALLDTTADEKAFLQDVDSETGTDKTRPKRRRRRRRRLTGWRAGVALFTAGALLSLMLNTTLAASFPASSAGIGVLWQGDCDRAAWYNRLVHVGTSAVSTLLLSGSSYCMQCLTAPTRRDLQHAHAEGVWLDVGVLSIRDLGRIAPYKAVLWFLIGLSSVPLHLLYNSAFFMSLDSNSYQVHFVSPDFWTTTDAVPVLDKVSNELWPLPRNATGYLNDIKNNQTRFGAAENNDVGSFKRLTVDECLAAYAKPFVSCRRTLIVTADGRADGEDRVPFAYGQEYLADQSVDTSAQIYEPYEWICESRTNTSSPPSSIPCFLQLPQLKNWEPVGFRPRYCHSQLVEGNCALNSSQPVILTVVICNAVKLAIMAIMLLTLRDHPLTTLGDAIQSFLETPDPTTRGQCLLSRDAVVKSRKDGHAPPLWPTQTCPEPALARRRRYRWSDAVSRRRWTVSLTTIGLSLLIVPILLGVSVPSTGLQNISVPLSRGFTSSLDGTLIVTNWSFLSRGVYGLRIVTAALVANLPQLIVSVVIFPLNGLVTAAFAAREWHNFSVTRKHLRVSEPRGDQRGTYFLQLPYRVAVPLNLASASISWLLSQSISAVVVTAHDAHGAALDAVPDVTCSFSHWPMTVVVLVGLAMLAGVCSFFFLDFVTCMPMAGTCSAAISAACHHQDGLDEVALQPVKWGAVHVEEVGEGEGEWVGHCCFTSSLVKQPKPGRLYA